MTKRLDWYAGHGVEVGRVCRADIVGTFGSIHIRGVGVEQNLTDAYMWLTLASQSNVPGLATQATTLRDDAVKQMNAEQVQDARRQARSWRPRRAGLISGG